MPSSHDPVELIDAAPVPYNKLAGNSQALGARRGRARLGSLRRASRAGTRGLKLFLVAHPRRGRRSPRAWPARGWANAEVAAGLLAHAARAGALRPGLTLIGDKGFTGRDFEDLVTNGFGMCLVPSPDRRERGPAGAWADQLDPAMDRVGQRSG